MCNKSTFLIFNLTVIIYLVEDVYYLKQVFNLLSLRFSLTVKIDIVEVVHYLKQVFHILCDKSVTKGHGDIILLFHNIMDRCIIR